MIQKALTKAEIVENVYQKLQMNRHEVKKIIETSFELMKDAIKDEKTLMISGFGKFEALSKKPRTGRNPQTKQSMTLDARNVVVFRISRKFREEINSNK